MHRKTIDPVTGRLYMKYSLQKDIKERMKVEKQRFEERFGHIETNPEFAEKQKEAEEEYQYLREMGIDNDKLLPDAKTRHWMIAQSHIVMEDVAK